MNQVLPKVGTSLGLRRPCQLNQKQLGRLSLEEVIKPQGQFPPTGLRLNQLGNLLATPAYVNLKEQEIRNFVCLLLKDALRDPDKIAYPLFFELYKGRRSL